MKSAARTPHLIDVHALRVGMFVHLDVGWMSHPFPLGSFRITSPAQLATICSLGLKRVRWDPQQSDPAEVEAKASAVLPASLAAGVAAGAVAPAGDEGEASTRVDDGRPRSEAAAQRTDADRHACPDFDPDTDRAALRRCERQFAEATRACRQTAGLVSSRPLEARAQAETLTQALLDKMLGEQDLCIRLLTEAAGDKASMHAINVMVVSLLMGRAFGFTEPELLDLGVGAMLHDIGKIDMPLRVRHRDASFTAQEQRDYEEHVAHGLRLARRMRLAPGATLVVAQHHEHADGSGFPLKLNTDRMTAAARIVALVDRYDNLCNPYFLAKALTPHEALSLLFAHGKSEFDTSILGGFIRMMGVYPPGSTVQLTDDRFATVVAVNSTRPLKPQVLVCEPGVPRERARIVDLERSDGIGIRRSIKAAQLPPAAIECLAPRHTVAYFFEPAERRA